MTGLDTARRVLDLALDRPPTLGHGRLVCVDGPAGSGKSTLAAALAHLAPARGRGPHGRPLRRVGRPAGRRRPARRAAAPARRGPAGLLPPVGLARRRLRRDRRGGAVRPAGARGRRAPAAGRWPTWRPCWCGSTPRTTCGCGAGSSATVRRSRRTGRPGPRPRRPTSPPRARASARTSGSTAPPPLPCRRPAGQHRITHGPVRRRGHRDRRHPALPDPRRPAAGRRVRRGRAARRGAAGSCSRRGPTGCATAAGRSAAATTSWRSASRSGPTRSTGWSAGARGGPAPGARRRSRCTTGWPRRSGYPWLLDLAVTYALGDDGLTVTAGGDQPVGNPAPYAAGAHPYFRVGRRPRRPVVAAAARPHPRAARRPDDPGGPRAGRGHGVRPHRRAGARATWRSTTPSPTSTATSTGGRPPSCATRRPAPGSRCGSTSTTGGCRCSPPTTPASGRVTRSRSSR